jgi:PPOX class probable F420-dependent enzyme
MRTGLGIEDLGGLLDEPIVAVLATYRRDGRVLLSPVWHEWVDGGFQIWTGANDVKTRHLRHDPRASVLVAESAIPLRGVEVRGEPTIITDGAVGIAERIAGRYLGAERGAGYVRTVGGNDVIIRLEPGEIRVWDFVDEYD